MITIIISTIVCYIIMIITFTTIINTITTIIIIIIIIIIIRLRARLGPRRLGVRRARDGAAAIISVSISERAVCWVMVTMDSVRVGNKYY